MVNEIKDLTVETITALDFNRVETFGKVGRTLAFFTLRIFGLVLVKAEGGLLQ